MSTLRTIADDLDLSVSLVSKVLSGRLGTTGASPETITLIHDAARRLNYRKNFSAESLATGKQRALGIFMHRHGVPGSSIAEATIIGAANRAAEAGQRLVLRFFQTAEEFADACAQIHSNALDGLIIAGVLHADLVLQLAERREDNLPLVTVHGTQTHEKVPNVSCDQFRVGELAAMHLIERGCKRIAHIRVQTNRYMGYQKALRDAGMPISKELIFDTLEYDHTDGMLAVEHWIKKGVEFDGVCAQSDQQLAGAMKAVLQAGKRIPEDVKMIGVDNSPYCDFFPIPLTSVSEEDQQRGEAAVDLLLALINGEPAESRNIEPRVVVRAST